MKRNVLMDGNGSDTVMIEGLGMYVPVSQVRSMQAEVERLRDRIGAQNNHISEINSRLQIPEDANGDLEQERDQLKAILQDVNTSDYRFSVEQLSAHDAEVIKQFVRDYTDWQGIDWMLTDFMHKRVDELSQKAKEVQS